MVLLALAKTNPTLETKNKNEIWHTQYTPTHCTSISVAANKEEIYFRYDTNVAAYTCMINICEMITAEAWLQKSVNLRFICTFEQFEAVRSSPIKCQFKAINWFWQFLCIISLHSVDLMTSPLLGLPFIEYTSNEDHFSCFDMWKPRMFLDGLKISITGAIRFVATG